MTNYGTINYQWATYASYFDLASYRERQLETQKFDQERSRRVTYKNDRIGNFDLQNLTGRCTSSLTEIKLNPPSNYKFSTKTILPKIKRTLNRCNEKSITRPIVPTIAEGTVI